MITLFSRFISVIFHPLLMATYLVSLFAYLFPVALYPITPESRTTFIGLVFLVTFVLPALNISFFRLFGFIPSFTMINRRDRVKPFLWIVLLYGFFTYLLASRTNLSIGDNLFNVFLIIDALVLVSFVITLFYKVSIHSMAIWGVLGILMPFNKVVEDGSLFIPMLATMVIAGLVMGARLQLNAHTPREVLVGALTGFGVSFFCMLILF